MFSRHSFSPGEPKWRLANDVTQYGIARVGQLTGTAFWHTFVSLLRRVWNTTCSLLVVVKHLQHLRGQIGEVCPNCRSSRDSLSLVHPSKKNKDCTQHYNFVSSARWWCVGPDSSSSLRCQLRGRFELEDVTACSTLSLKVSCHLPLPLDALMSPMRRSPLRSHVFFSTDFFVRGFVCRVCLSLRR